LKTLLGELERWIVAEDSRREGEAKRVRARQEQALRHARSVLTASPARLQTVEALLGEHRVSGLRVGPLAERIEVLRESLTTLAEQLESDPVAVASRAEELQSSVDELAREIHLLGEQRRQVVNGIGSVEESIERVEQSIDEKRRAGLPVQTFLERLAAS
jgi:chromosome segregation ATPase